MKNAKNNENDKVGPGAYDPKTDFTKPKPKGFVIKKE